MKSLLITISFLFVFQSFNAQKSLGERTMSVEELEKTISSIKSNLSTFSIDSLNFYFEKNLNEYRNSFGIGSVVYDKSILKVSNEQSSYCLKNGSLSHKQVSDSKKYVGDRCKFYGVECLEAYENLMMGNIVNLLILKYSDGMNFYDCLSNLILTGWKNSTVGHNSTLLEYYGQKFSLSVSTNSKNDMVACFVMTSD